MTSLSPDFSLGYRLAAASNSELRHALWQRPADLTRLRHTKTLIERILPIIDRSLSSNERALSRLVPDSTDGNQPPTSEANAGGAE